MKEDRRESETAVIDTKRIEATEIVNLDTIIQRHKQTALKGAELKKIEKLNSLKLTYSEALKTGFVARKTNIDCAHNNGIKNEAHIPHPQIKAPSLSRMSYAEMVKNGGKKQGSI